MHHSQYIAGRYDDIIDDLCAFLDEHDLPSRGHADFWALYSEVCGIDDARALSEHQSRRAVAGDTKVCVLGCSRITREAQNALLKTTEEPVSGTHIILIMPKPDSLLPTLKSRLSKFDLTSRVSSVFATEADTFLKSSHSKRLKQVSKLLAGVKETGRRDDIEQFVYALLTASREKNIEYIKHIAQAEEELGVKGVPPKFVLERLALVLPKL